MFESIFSGSYIGLLGILAILGVAAISSTNSRKIDFFMVGRALTAQLFLAFIILKTDAGKWFFKQLAAGFQHIYSFADQGASFVFGSLSDPSQSWGWIFGVKVIPIIIFFGALTSLLFHLGIVQIIVGGMAFLVRPVLGTSGAETLCAAANSMLGQTEAPLLIKQYIPTMTRSEILVVMVSGMATLSGAILAVYGGMGVSVLHLLSASVMSIPGSVLIAKMLLPETEKRDHASDAALAAITPQTENILDALAQGTLDGLTLAVNVAAMLITFISLMSMINAAMSFISLNTVGVSITLDVVFGKLFSNVAFLIGIAPADTEVAGMLIGKKLVINEFVAYAEMLRTQMTVRSREILTYALCGFSNFSCIGIQIGGIGALAPQKRVVLTQLGMRALLGGTLANLLNAAIASLFIA